MPINAIASRWDRRWFLRLSSGLAGALTACKPTRTVEQAEPSNLGKPLSAYGERSPFEKTARLSGPTKNLEIGASRTPLQDSYGVLTPSALLPGMVRPVSFRVRLHQ